MCNCTSVSSCGPWDVFCGLTAHLTVPVAHIAPQSSHPSSELWCSLLACFHTLPACCCPLPACCCPLSISHLHQMSPLVYCPPPVLVSPGTPEISYVRLHNFLNKWCKLNCVFREWRNTEKKNGCNYFFKGPSFCQLIFTTSKSSSDWIHSK